MPQPNEKRIYEGSEVRLAENPIDGKPAIQIYGCAAPFNRLSRPMQDDNGEPFRETIMPGAFSKVLATNPDVCCRVNHEGGLCTIGRTTNGTLKLHEDAAGLQYECQPPDTQAGRDIVTLIRRGDIKHCSFAFRVADDGEDWGDGEDMPLRTIREIGYLGDVSPADSPAYLDTHVAARSLTEWRKKQSEVKPTGETARATMRLRLAEID